jgi:hypothetical protein
MALADKNIANEAFWLNMAVENIYSSFVKRATSVKNLKEVITWTFTIFTGAGFVGSIFGTSIKNYNQTSLVLFALAFFLLTLAYVLAGQAQYPVSRTFHPNDVSDISNAFGAAVKIQTNYFRLAAGTTMAGFFFIALAILFLFYHAKEAPETKKISVNPLLLTTSVEKKGEKYFIPVTIMTDRDKNPVSVSISAVKDKAEMLLLDNSYLTDTSGRAFISYAVPDSIRAYDSFKVKVGISDKTADTLPERFTSLKIGKK